MQNDVLATGIMSFLMHEIVYFGRSVFPWMIIDHVPYFRKYKIQHVRLAICQRLKGVNIFKMLTFTLENSKRCLQPKNNGIVRN